MRTTYATMITEENRKKCEKILGAHLPERAFEKVYWLIWDDKYAWFVPHSFWRITYTIVDRNNSDPEFEVLTVELIEG